MAKRISLILAITLGVILYFVVSQWWLGILTAVIVYHIVHYFLARHFDRDAIYIRETLKVARKKAHQIHQYSGKWRMWKIWFKVRYIKKINNEIISTIGHHPNRFPKADKFFSLYLDSTVNILEKYDTLVHQPVRNAEVQKSLRNTELMLDDVIKGLEQQLSSVLEADMMELEIEKEVIKQHTN